MWCVRSPLKARLLDWTRRKGRTRLGTSERNVGGVRHALPLKTIRPFWSTSSRTRFSDMSKDDADILAFCRFRSNLVRLCQFGISEIGKVAACLGSLKKFRFPRFQKVSSFLDRPVMYVLWQATFPRRWAEAQETVDGTKVLALNANQYHL